jgi:hypothetical protein
MNLRAGVSTGAFHICSSTGMPASQLDTLPLLDARTQAGGGVVCVAIPESTFHGSFNQTAHNQAAVHFVRALPEAGNEQACDNDDGEPLFTGSHFNTAWLYHAIKPKGDEPQFTDTLPGLLATLRPFQVRLVSRPSPRLHISR